MSNWFDLKRPAYRWLVHGLLAKDSHSSIFGKAKSGKSLLVRNIAVAVVKGHDVLGRKVDVPAGGGRVLYIHLDRKDPIYDVAHDLRSLGIGEKDKDRLRLLSAQDMPKKIAERLPWLQSEVKTFRPDLIVIDLLFQFVKVDESNGYNVTIEKLNELQDALVEIKYTGHLITLHHARKAKNEHEPFDDMMGTGGIRGSFSTNILMRFYRDSKMHTITTDQTQRDDTLGEIEETVLEKDPDGDLRLGRRLREIVAEEKSGKKEFNVFRVMSFIDQHPGCSQQDIMKALNISKKTLLPILNEELVRSLTVRGTGKAGDPYLYAMNGNEAKERVIQ